MRGFLVEFQRSPNAHKYGLVPLIMINKNMYAMCIRKSNASGRMMVTNSSNYQLPCGWPLVDLAEVFALSTWNNPEELWGSVG